MKKPTEIKHFPGRAVDAHLKATGHLPGEPVTPAWKDQLALEVAISILAIPSDWPTSRRKARIQLLILEAMAGRREATNRVEIQKWRDDALEKSAEIVERFGVDPLITSNIRALKTWQFTEEKCPGHVASNGDPKICDRCGVHIDSLRPDDDSSPLSQFAGLKIERLRKALEEITKDGPIWRAQRIAREALEDMTGIRQHGANR